MGTRSKNAKPGTVNNKIDVPFYELPPRKTTSEIINEAKIAIKGHDTVDNKYAQTSVKPIQTQRPFTPREKERLLFGKKSKPNRPPSSFSLRYLQSENELSIPTTTPEDDDTTSPRRNDRQRANSVTEISENKIFNVGVKEVGIQKIKLPSLETKSAKKLPKIALSFDQVVEESKPSNRNAFSSPQEKTDHNEKLRNESPFGRPSKKQTLSECLLLPQNLMFANKQIIEDSANLFERNCIRNANKTDLCKEKSTNDVIDILNASKNGTDDEIIDLLDKLYVCMEKENLLSGNINSKMRIYLLKSLYKFVESHNEELLLALARIILALKVTGNNLSGVCKLIFKVAKNDKNDHLFLRKNILELFIDAVGRCSPWEDAEACVYGYGAIKFLTMNTTLLQRNIDLGILPLMVLHLKIINNFKLEKNYISEHTNHALFQLTGALRNLAGNDEMYDAFVESRAIEQLCVSLKLFSSDLDVITNISRTLSTLSTNNNCCDHISEQDGVEKAFVKLFDKYPGNDEIIIRLTYAMGNIVARVDEARIRFYQEENSIPSLISLWKVYLERTLKHYSLRIDNEIDNCGNSEDVMIKIIRIIANLAINSDIGKKMNDNHGIKLIDELLKVLISNPFKRNEELVLSVLSTLNNLSFYYTNEIDPDVFHVKQIDVMDAITEYITQPKNEAAIEAMRILGNLSRSSITRNYIAQNDLLPFLIDVLDKDDVNLLRTTIGVFVNLMADNRNRASLRNHNGVSKLIKAMDAYGQYDWSLAMLACQVIWNYCIDTINLYQLMSDKEVEQLTAVLVDFLDEEKLFGGDAPKDNEGAQEYFAWEEFANVATNLMDKIELFLDTVERNEVQVKSNIRDSSTNISFSSW